jgi:mannosyltransferase
MSAVTAGVRPGATADPSGRRPEHPIAHRRRFGIFGGGTGSIATIVGLFAAAIAFAGSWIPSYWGDEAASVMSAERPIPTLFTMVQRVDAVHGVYYLFLHGWIQLFGASEVSTRLPSAIGIGLAAAGTVVLAALLFDRRVALVAGIVFASLPRVSYMGAEARSYALGTAMAVWLTVFLYVLLRRKTVRFLPWLAYGLGFSLAVYWFLYLILLGVVHAIVLITMTRNRALMKRWLAAVVIGVVLAGPVIGWGLGEHGQIEFLGSRPKFDPRLVFDTQWFGTIWHAIACWALILLAIGASFLAWRRRRRAGSNVASPPARVSDPTRVTTRPVGMILAVSWLILPTALLLLGNAFIAPMYTTRYLSFCTPAVALVIAVGVMVLARNWMRVAVVGILLGLAAPTYLAQRGPYAKDGGSDWRQFSAIIGQHAEPGDAIVFDNAIKPSQKPRSAYNLYPNDYRGLDDVELVTPFAESPVIWDVVAPIEQVTAKLTNTTTVWAAEMKPSGSALPPDVLELQQLGFRVTHTYPVHRTTVYELSREPS